MSLRKKQSIFCRNIACLIEFAFDVLEIELTFGEAHRTNSQMLLNFFGYEVVKKGNGITLQKSRKLSNTLLSKHGDRLAVDFNFFINGKLTYDYHKIKSLGDYWESLHPDNRWGGDWNQNDKPDGFIDTPHFEMR
jgi:hypothetical protein